MAINKRGIWTISSSSPSYLVNNFGESNTITDWTVSGSLANNVLTLTGVSPQMTSKSFTVNPNDVIVIEFSLAFKILSDNSGVFIGSKGDANTSRWVYNTALQKWEGPYSNASSSWSTYWLSNYNSTTKKTVKSYIIGSDVDITKVPPPSGTNQLIQLNSGNTTTNIRTGYNANNGMTFDVYYFKVYNINDINFAESGEKTQVSKNFIHANSFIEI